MMKANLKDQICEFLKVKREAKGLSQANLAALAFGDKGTRQKINKMEKGTWEKIDVKSLEKILDILNCRIELKENN